MVDVRCVRVGVSLVLGAREGVRREREGKTKRNERNSDSPNPKHNGAKKIILGFDAPERWYADNIHALKTISSVIGACVYVSICGKERRG